MAASLPVSMSLIWKTTPNEPFPQTLTLWYWMSVSTSVLPSKTCSEMTR